MLIPIAQGRSLFTQAFIGSWKETYPVTNFGRTYFQNKTVPTKFVSTEVRRGFRNIAADVERGADPNYNKGTVSTEKIYQPPYFYEAFTSNELNVFDQLFATQGDVVDSAIVAAATQEVRDMFDNVRNKIERAYEKQSWQCLQTGVVTSSRQDNLDFKAKATHIKTLNTKWDNATPKIFDSIREILDTLKADGAAAVEFDVILGTTAADTFFASDEYAKISKTYPLVPGNYIMPQAQMQTGAVFHNRIPVGPYIINILTYNEGYETVSGTTRTYVPYIDPKKVVVIARSFTGFMTFAAVPRLLTAPTSDVPQFAQVMDQGAYVLNNYTDPQKAVHVFDIKSAGVPIPLTIDHFACLTVLA